ncbi:MAG: hypothetical protein ACQETB_04645 [Halobacteriota archaeon]
MFIERKRTVEDRATIDIINFWSIVAVLTATVAVASVVGAAVFVGEFDEPEEDEDPIETVDEGVSISDPEGGEVTVRWTDAGDATHMVIRNEDDLVLGRLDYFGDETTVVNRRFAVVAVYEDGSEEVVGRHEP